jgi:hypothetical protein
VSVQLAQAAVLVPVIIQAVGAVHAETHLVVRHARASVVDAAPAREPGPNSVFGLQVPQAAVRLLTDELVSRQNPGAGHGSSQVGAIAQA